MLYRAAAILPNGDMLTSDVDSLEEGNRLFDLVAYLPWGPAVSLEIQASIDGVEWDTIRRRDRDADQVERGRKNG